MHSSRVDDVGPCKAGSLGARKLVLGIGYTASHRAGSSNQRILGEDRYSDPVFLAVLCMLCLQGLTNVHELAPIASWAKFPGRNRNPGIGQFPPVLTIRAVQIGAPPWRSMRPVDKQEVRQVCSDRHETCTLLFQLFEIYNLVH